MWIARLFLSNFQPPFQRLLWLILSGLYMQDIIKLILEPGLFLPLVSLWLVFWVAALLQSTQTLRMLWNPTIPFGGSLASTSTINPQFASRVRFRVQPCRAAARSLSTVSNSLRWFSNLKNVPQAHPTTWLPRISATIYAQ